MWQPLATCALIRLQTPPVDIPAPISVFGSWADTLSEPQTACPVASDGAVTVFRGLRLPPAIMGGAGGRAGELDGPGLSRVPQGRAPRRPGSGRTPVLSRG